MKTNITTKSGKIVRVRIMRGATTCHGALVTRSGRVVAESDVVRPAFAADAAERDAIALAARI